MNDRDVIFDRRELPTATLVPRESLAVMRVTFGELRGWFAARWAWIRPRTVPLLVATVGMFAVLLSTDYLAHGHGGHLVPECVVVHVGR